MSEVASLPISQESAKKIQWISIARAISIIFIIIFHIYLGELRYTFYEGTNVFFAISGYVVALSLIKKNVFQTGDWFLWWKQRLIRLYPLWLIVLWIAFIAYSFNLRWIDINVSSSNTFNDFILHVFMLHVFSSSSYYSINIAWWFQGIIVQCYLLTPLFYLFIRSKSSVLRIVVLCWFLFVLANIFFKTFAPHNKLLIMFISQACGGWLWYLMGMIYALKGSNIILANRNCTKLSLFLFITCVFYIVLNYYVLSNITSTGAIFNALNSIAVVFLIITISQFLALLINTDVIIKYVSSFLSWLGSLSYPAYLSHMFLVSILMLPLPWLFRIALYFFTVFLVSYFLANAENRLKVLLRL